MMWTEKTADYMAYSKIYKMDEFRDGGFAMLCRICSSAGIEFKTFFLMFGAIGILSFLYFTIRYSQRCSLVAALFLGCICFFDIVQIRNFVAFSIVLCGIPLLFDTNKIKILKYWILVTIASSIHITAAFFALLPLFNKDVLNFKRFDKNTLLIIVFIIALIFLFPYFSQKFSNLSEHYLVGASSLSKIMIFIMIIVNILFIGYWSKKNPHIKNAPIKYMVSSESQIILYLNLSMLILMPMAMMSLHLLRLYKYFAIINLSYVTNQFHMNKPYAFDLGISWDTIITSVYAFSYLALYYVIWNSDFIIGVIYPIFYENLLLPPFL